MTSKRAISGLSLKRRIHSLLSCDTRAIVIAPGRRFVSIWHVWL